MDPESTVRCVLSMIEQDDMETAQEALDGLRDWCKRGGFRPYGWTAEMCAAFVTACAHTINTLSTK